MKISSDQDFAGKNHFHIHLTEDEYKELTGFGEKKPRVHSIEYVTGDARYEKVVFTLTCKRFLRLKERWLRSRFKSRLKILTGLGLPLDKAVEVYRDNWEELPPEIKAHFE